MFKRGKKRKAQIWVETVIYTLIALVMIGTVISVVKPKIEESQDRAIIEQSMSLLKDIDSIIIDIKRVSGNQRIIELGVKKGNLLIDAVGDKIIFEIESRYEYSEPGESIVDGASGIIIETTKVGKLSDVVLTKDYSEDYNITYLNKDELKSIPRAATPYRITLSNKGKDKFGENVICTSQTVEVDCINAPEGYIENCIGGLCNYISDKITININIG